MDIDRLLTEAGGAWRKGQAPPPAIDRAIYVRARRRVRPLWLMPAAGIAVALTLVVGVVATRQPDLPSSGVTPAGADASPSPLPGGQPSPPISAGSPSSGPDLGTLGWFLMTSSAGCPKSYGPESPCSNPAYPRTAQLLLTAGLMNGQDVRTVRRELPGILDPSNLNRAYPVAWMSGSTAVMYSLFDGNVTELHRLDIGSGIDETVITIHDPIYKAVVQQSTGMAYLSLVDAKTKHDAGIYVLEPGGTAPTRIVAPRTNLAFDIAANPWERDLFLTPDGARLAVLDCQDRRCDLTTYLTSTGSEDGATKGLSQGIVYGITNSELVGDFVCSGGTCSTVALPLGSGASRTIPVGCGVGLGAVIETEAGGEVAVFVTRGPDCSATPGLRVWTAATGKLRAITQDLGSGPGVLGPAARAANQNYAAPAGWLLLGPGGQLLPGSSDPDPVLLNVSDDRTITLTGLPRGR